MPAGMEPTRLYLKTSTGGYRRLLWFHNHRPNEMLMGTYSLTGGPAILGHEFPEYELDESELASVRYDHGQAVTVGQPVDHVTCHADGRIHVKTRTEARYVHAVQHVEPLGPNTGTFLRFIVITDLVQKYSSISGPPKSPYAWIQGDEQQLWLMQGAFSGKNYHLEADIAATIQHLAGDQAVIQPAVQLVSGTLKGLVWGQPRVVPAEMLNNRPAGTIVSFKFPAAHSRWIIKTFIFQ